ncbi:MAG: hypothetical protein K5678_00900 [Acetatifactor sp.]|nr:hypothetical protein [Acetatifactor sp.]
MTDIAKTKIQEKKRLIVVKIAKKWAVFCAWTYFERFLAISGPEKMSNVHNKKALSLVEISNMYLLYGKN